MASLDFDAFAIQDSRLGISGKKWYATGILNLICEPQKAVLDYVTSYYRGYNEPFIKILVNQAVQLWDVVSRVYLSLLLI